MVESHWAQTRTPDPFIPLASLADMERVHILSTLQHTGWNKTLAASILGIERSTLDRKIQRYALTEEAPRRS